MSMTTAKHEEKSAAPTLVQQIAHYFSGQVLVFAAGFFSMPILTRLLGTERYGTVNLVVSMMFLLMAVGKFGLSHAAVRFAGRPEPGQMKRERALQSSLLLMSLFMSVVVALLVAGMVRAVTSGAVAPGTPMDRLLSLVVGTRANAPYMVFAGLLVIPRTVTALVWALQRSEQKSKAWTAYSVLLRYGSLVCGLASFLTFRTLPSYFWGVIGAESVVTLFYFTDWWRTHRLSVGLFRLSLIRMCLAYGLPLIVYEVATVLVNYCDRFIIAHFWGNSAVGLYSASYGVAEILPMVLAFPIELALTPYCFRLWDQEGQQRTAEFVASSSARYAILAFPALAMFAVAGRSVVGLISGREYLAGASVIPWVLAGMGLWQGFYPLVSMGFLVKKRSSSITVILLVAVLMNALLNWVLVPRVGYNGAAVATFLTFAAILVMTGIGSARHMPVRWQWPSLLRALGFSVAAATLVSLLPVGHGLLAALVRVALGSVLYARAIVALDDNARWVVAEGYKALAERGLPAGWLGWLTGRRAASAA